MFQGSMVALVTPMRADGAVDVRCLRDLIEWHIAEGSDAIVAVGTTGESATLDEAEHVQVIRLTVEQVRKRIPVIAGTGANATAEAITLTQAAQAAGADAALLVTPYYNRPTQEGLYQHYQAIAQACSIPQILYNVPGRTGCDLLPATVARLAPTPNIVGVKEATGNIDRSQEIMSLCAPEFAVYAGDDATAMALMLLGARGVISVTANVAPGRMAALCRAALAGDIAEAHTLNESLLPLHRELFAEPNPIPVKWALSEMGRSGPTLRLPLTPLSRALHERVRAALHHGGCL